jgi:hypothetical protein
METLSVFDKFILHLKFEDDRIYFILRGNAPIGDYEWWHGMNPRSGSDDPLIREVQSDHIDYPPVERMLEQNILLDRSICHKPSSPFGAGIQPPSKLVELRVWLIYPLMIIQEFPSTTPSFCKVAETVLTNITRVAMIDEKLQYSPVEYNITMVPLLVCSRIKYNFVRNAIICNYPLGNAPAFNGHMSEDIMKTLHNKTLMISLNL